jgi:hypothetical protein
MAGSVKSTALPKDRRCTHNIWCKLHFRTLL